MIEAKLPTSSFECSQISFSFEVKSHKKLSTRDEHKVFKTMQREEDSVMKDGKEVDAKSGSTTEFVGVGKGRVEKC